MRRPQLFVATLAACAAVIACEKAAHAVLAAGTCTGLTKTEFTVSANYESTSAISYVDVADGGRIAFTTARKGCVVVTFSAEPVISTADNRLILRVLLDGKPSCPPYENVFAYQPTNGREDDVRTITLVCSGVRAATHHIQIQFRSNDGATAVALYQRTLTVSHR